MSMEIQNEKEKIKQLLAKGKEKGVLSYEEIMETRGLQIHSRHSSRA